MKRIFLILISILALSCSKNDNNDEEIIDPINLEFGIPKDIEIKSHGIVETQGGKYLFGKKGYNIYLYKVEGSKIIAEYQETLPETIEVNLGFGEKYTFDGKDSHFNIFGKKANVFVIYFLKSSRDYYIEGLSWVFDGKKFKKIRLPKYKIDGGIDTKNIDDKINIVRVREEAYFVYKTNWDLLYKKENYESIDIKEVMDYGHSINEEEIITFRVYAGTPISFKRVNLKTDKVDWETKFQISANEKYRIDKTEVSKDKKIWTFTVDYTLYSGEKKTEKIKVNIDNGEIIK